MSLACTFSYSVALTACVCVAVNLGDVNSCQFRPWPCQRPAHTNIEVGQMMGLMDEGRVAVEDILRLG